jgi:predicted Rossmann fold flavoprotein
LVRQADVIVIGAGASGLMAAAQAGRRGRSVLVLDHAASAGRKILMSGGGHCNFTNRDVRPEHYISHNPHFCKSALSRFSQWDLLDWVQKYGIAYCEREQGRLFCRGGARQILNALLTECRRVKVTLIPQTVIEKIEMQGPQAFGLWSSQGRFNCQSLVVATGGLSVPSAGSSALGHAIARQFQIKVWPTFPGLVPLTLCARDKQRFSSLAGLSVDAVVYNHRQRFHDHLLFTHRGLSGPAILQISSYWRPGEQIVIDLLPDVDMVAFWETQRRDHPRRSIKAALAHLLPKRLVAALIPEAVGAGMLQHLGHEKGRQIASMLQQWELKPGGTEGYRSAEVTVGGVDCDALSSKTMEARQVPGLFFVGEVMDMTGWLGGYNLQWAWSSGWCAGQYC